MAEKAKIPKLSAQAEVRAANFILETLHEGWCLATENTVDCVLMGSHDYGLAVAPDGNFGVLHWRSSAKKFDCHQVYPGSNHACFGRFDAEFPGSTSLDGISEVFRVSLPVLQQAHRVWLTRPKSEVFKDLSVDSSGDLSRDVELLKGPKQNPAETTELTALYQAIHGISEANVVTQDALIALKQGMSSSFQSVWSRSGDLLIQLSHDHPEVGEAFVEGMSHKRSMTRLHTVQSIFSVRPKPELSCRVLGLGLRDKSKVVREFSGDRIEMLRLVDLLPDLEAAIAVERDPEVAYKLKTDRSLLKFGVRVAFDNRTSGYEIWVRRPNGIASSDPIPKSRFNKKKLEEYVANLNGDVTLLKNWTKREILQSNAAVD